MDFILYEKTCWPGVSSAEPVHVERRPVGTFLVSQPGTPCQIKLAQRADFKFLWPALYLAKSSDCKALECDSSHSKPYHPHLNRTFNSDLQVRACYCDETLSDQGLVPNYSNLSRSLSIAFRGQRLFLSVSAGSFLNFDFLGESKNGLDSIRKITCSADYEGLVFEF